MLAKRLRIYKKLEYVVRKREKNKDKELDDEIAVKRVCDILPSSIEQRLFLENRDKEASCVDNGKHVWQCTHGDQQPRRNDARRRTQSRPRQLESSHAESDKR